MVRKYDRNGLLINDRVSNDSGGLTSGLWTWIDPSLATAPRELEELQQTILKKAIAPAVLAASKVLAAAEKAGVARNRTGLLRESIGTTRAKVYKDALTAWAGSGPRRGFRRLIIRVVTKRGSVRLKKTSQQFSENHEGQTFFGSTPKWADPVKYAGLVISGHQPVVAGIAKGKATGKKSLFDSFNARFLGHQTKAAQPKDFMAPAAAQAGHAEEVYARELDSRLAKLAVSH